MVKRPPSDFKTAKGMQFRITNQIWSIIYTSIVCKNHIDKEVISFLTYKMKWLQLNSLKFEKFEKPPKNLDTNKQR